VQRRRYKYAVAADLGQSCHVTGISDATANQQRRTGSGLPHPGHEIHVGPALGADTPEVEDDDCACARISRPGGDDMRWRIRQISMRGPGFPEAKVEAERRAAGADCGAYAWQRVESAQRFEADHHMGCSEAVHMTGVPRRGRPGIDPQRREAGQVFEEGVLGLPSQNRVKVSDVQFRQAEVVQIGARQRDRVALDGGSGSGPDRAVGLATAQSRVHGAAGHQVDYANDAHPIGPAWWMSS
jgi:hypothetical protein